VLDIRELGRRAGSMKHVVRQVPAPAQLGTEMIYIPPGALIEMDVRLEAVMEGVLVSGVASTPLAGECSRCLEAFEDRTAVDIRELFYYPDRLGADTDDDDCRQIVNDHLDLEPTLRDALILSLPLSPRCRPDCPGLCVDCGVRLDDCDPDHDHGWVDPRWAGLPSLVENPLPVENPALIDNKEKN
jgi:uncharacterized protein